VSGRLDPSVGSVQYAVRKPLVDWLRGQQTDARVLDVGCGDRPYRELFPNTTGFDVPGNPHADLHGSLESIPVEDASFDAVLCLQVLEHVPDPAPFARKLLATGRAAIVSVPYRWPAGELHSHRHDLVDEAKLREWTGADPIDFALVDDRGRQRLICVYRA
jgi:SAM-dependent methyltransferase